MSQVILFNHNYKGTPNVVLCIPTGELPIEEVFAKDVPPDATNAAIVDRSIVPDEWFEYHAAWSWDGETLSIDIPKAKEVTKDRLRIEREPLLVAQDVLFQRALETGADTTAIVAEKQRLRNLPTLADTCTTLDELRALKA